MSDYYIWLLDQIKVNEGESFDCYRRLVWFLYTEDYSYLIDKDSNRAYAGLNLRELYSMETGVDVNDIKTGPCSILEMLIALANQIAFDKNDDTYIWFWEIVTNLGLTDCDDENYDEKKIAYRLKVWMNREYNEWGYPFSLFPIQGFKGDMRTLETWDQMNNYMTTFYPVVLN